MSPSLRAGTLARHPLEVSRFRRCCGQEYPRAGGVL